MKTPCRKILIFLPALALSACAAYHPRPLPETPGLAARVPRLSVEAERLRAPGVKPHPFDPSDGLDMTEVAMLAAVNNPRLKAARARAGIGRAQLFSAGLLPDPEFALDLQHPTGGGVGLVNAMSLALNYPLQALVGRGAARTSAAAHLRRLDLEVMWQEWQVVQQARILHIRLIRQDRQLRLLREYRSLLKKGYDNVNVSVRSGNMTADASTSFFTSLLSVNTRLNELERGNVRTREAMAGLLGLDPKVELALVDSAAIETISDRELDDASTALAEGRPDLRALRAGYESEDALLRKAILEQFPGLSVGVSRARDTDGVKTIGIGVTLRLPFFNGNRGEVAIEEATREQLWSAYEARLAEAHIEVHKLRSEERLLERQLRQLPGRLTDLEEMVSGARLALDEGNLDILSYLTFETGLLDKRIELAQLEGTLQEVRVALQTVLGIPVDEAAAR